MRPHRALGVARSVPRHPGSPGDTRHVVAFAMLPRGFLPAFPATPAGGAAAPTTAPATWPQTCIAGSLTARPTGGTMHGMMLAELKKYVDDRLGGDTWKTLLKEAGIGVKIYLPTQTYDDAEVVSIVTTAARVSNTPLAAILEDFGTFIVPDLVGVYGAYIKPEWKTLDLI